MVGKVSLLQVELANIIKRRDTMKVSDETMLFRKVDDEPMTAEEVLTRVYQSIQEKGYNPINQILGYLISGDPAYITSYNNARSDIRRLERDDLIEELLKEYAKAKQL